MSKRPGGFSLSGTANKVRKLKETTRRTNTNNSTATTKNPFLSERVMDITTTIGDFMTDARNQAVASEGSQQFEVEARFGVLHVGQSRVTSSGAKTDANHTIIPAFVCPPNSTASMDSGVSRRHFKQRTGAGLGTDSTIALALGVPRGGNAKSILEETRYIETNFAYDNNRRLVLDGEFDAHIHPGSELNPPGRYEYKTRMVFKDLIIPAANYDMRISLASEKTTERVPKFPPNASLHRVKRRVSYKRRDGRNPWQIDVTAVTSTDLRKKSKSTTVYEIEMELQAKYMDQLMKEKSPEKLKSMIGYISEKLWEIMQHLNPLEETIDVEEKLEPHPNQKAVSLALATCGALKKFMDDGQPNNFSWPITNPTSAARSASLRGLPGCMPVNFHREDMEKVQVASDNDYFLSEKTDGVRHFMIFTGDSVVLVDRALNAKRPKVLKSNGDDPMADLVKLVQPGTVLDGEVVMHRGTPHTANGMQYHEARPIFDAFDVMMVGGNPILHHKFEVRLRALQQASFCHNPKVEAGKVFPKSVADMTIPLPMVRKRFVTRRQIGELFGCVVEEKGFRSYRSLPLYNHLTDGVIFQPNTPYKCGTDHDLSKWKYPDTATIDVKLLEEHVYRSDFGGRKSMNDDEDEIEIFPVVACQDSVVVDMKRHIHLPRSDLYRLNADRFEIRKNIAEVGKDPASGEWYYLTMRPDKTDANHISTVLGTTLELAEALDWKELQYTMQLRSDESNNWSREQSKMDDVLMETQRLKHQKMNSKK